MRDGKKSMIDLFFISNSIQYKPWIYFSIIVQKVTMS